jgi:hypothetical protein
MRDHDCCFSGDADIEQAELEAAGRVAARGDYAMRRLRAAGQLAAAARACLHGWGYPTDSQAARNERDPRAGQPGFRCLNCGSYFAERNPHLSDLRSLTAAAPCELEPR